MPDTILVHTWNTLLNKTGKDLLTLWNLVTYLLILSPWTAKSLQTGYVHYLLLYSQSLEECFGTQSTLNKKSKQPLRREDKLFLHRKHFLESKHFRTFGSRLCLSQLFSPPIVTQAVRDNSSTSGPGRVSIKLGRSLKFLPDSQFANYFICLVYCYTPSI